MEYKVGAYVRLSRDDEIKKTNFSESINNQKEYILNYISDNNLNLINIYVDDGFSGTNFDRPSSVDCVKISRKIPDALKKVLARYKVLSFEAKGYTANLKESFVLGGTYSFSVDCDDYCDPDEYEKLKYELYRINHMFIFSQGEEIS